MLSLLDVLSFRWANNKEITKFRAKSVTDMLQSHFLDCGSSAVQVGVMTVRVRALSEHIKAHPQDKKTKYALTRLISRRQRMMRYLKRTDVEVWLFLLFLVWFICCCSLFVLSLIICHSIYLTFSKGLF